MSAKRRINAWRSFVQTPKEERKNLDDLTPKQKKRLKNTEMAIKDKLDIMEEQIQNAEHVSNQIKGLPKTLDDVQDVDQSKIKSLNDNTFVTVNDLDNRRNLETGQYEVFARRQQQERNHEEAKNNRRQQQQKKQRMLNSNRTSANDASDDAVNGNERTHFKPPMEKERIGPLSPVKELPVENLDEHHYAEDDNMLFTQKLRKRRSEQESIASIPSRNTIMSYVAKYKDELPWFQHNINTVINTEGLDFQKMETVNRAYIALYLREVDPNAPDERPCMNLDHDPVHGEIGFRCESHRLSSDWMGSEKAFKCREFLLPSIHTQIAAAKKHNRRVEMAKRKAKSSATDASDKAPLVSLNPCKWLPEVPEMCFLCYLKFVNRCYFGELFNDVERNNTDLTNAEATPNNSENDDMSIYHKFMVDVGPGEYALRYTLTGDRCPHGIVGPFPLYMESCYVPQKKEDGLWHFDESDELVFRHGQETLSALQSVSRRPSMVEQNTSSQSTQ